MRMKPGVLMMLSTAAMLSIAPARAQPPTPTLGPLVRVVDLQLNQPREVELCDGRKVAVKLLELQETRDSVRDAVREAVVLVEIAGRTARLRSANYQLPIVVGDVQVDCPVTRGYVANSSKQNILGLEADARIRLWPKGSPLMNPGTFLYPVSQRWLVSSTQMANEPCYVDAGERPKNRSIYYHYGLDFGGCEHLVEVFAATDSLVVSARTEKLDGYDKTPVAPRYDVVYLLDARGWFYRYSHMAKIEDAIKPGITVKAGTRLGWLGKEGASGGWTHLHFDVFCLMPSGQYGCQEAYAFVWEAWVNQHKPPLIAVARPHQVAYAGEKVALDGSRSWSADGKIASYEWTFCDGTTAKGERVERAYDKAGYYSETLKVTDSQGRSEYDFAIVHVHERRSPDIFPPTIHVTYHPSLSPKAGQDITFKVRTFATTDGQETWDFGDGSPAQTTKSDGNVKALNKDGYAVLTHRYEKPGTYIVRIQRTSAAGHTAYGHVCVRVE